MYRSVYTGTYGNRKLSQSLLKLATNSTNSHEWHAHGMQIRVDSCYWWLKENLVGLLQVKYIQITMS